MSSRRIQRQRLSISIEKKVHRLIKDEADKQNMGFNGVIKMWHDSFHDMLKPESFYRQTHPSKITMNAIRWNNLCLRVL